MSRQPHPGKLSQRQLLILFAAYHGKFRKHATYDDDLTEVLFGHKDQRFYCNWKVGTDRTLTASERASKSRSVRRLVDAGLVATSGPLVTLTDEGVRLVEHLRDKQLVPEEFSTHPVNDSEPLGTNVNQLDNLEAIIARGLAGKA